MRSFSIVVAMDEAGGIGKSGSLVWHLPPDLKRFKELTTGVSQAGRTNAVIMGRKTWESLREKFRPLPGRLNMVLTQHEEFSLPAQVVKSKTLDEALKYVSQHPDIEHVFVIGGAQLYAEAVNHPACSQIFATFLKGNFHCDAFFPPIPGRFYRDQSTSPWLSFFDITYRFEHYKLS